MVIGFSRANIKGFFATAHLSWSHHQILLTWLKVGTILHSFCLYGLVLTANTSMSTVLPLSSSLVNGCCCGAYLTILQSRRRYHYWACKVSGKKELLFAKPCRYVQFLLRTLYFPEKYYVVSRLIFWFLRNIYEYF